MTSDDETLFARSFFGRQPTFKPALCDLSKDRDCKPMQSCRINRISQLAESRVQV